MLDSLEYVADNGRHLVCLPYSVPNLHRMAKDLGIGKHWFETSKLGLPHYDIPVKAIPYVLSQCRVVSTRELITLVRNELK